MPEIENKKVYGGNFKSAEFTILIKTLRFDLQKIKKMCKASLRKFASRYFLPSCEIPIFLLNEKKKDFRNDDLSEKCHTSDFFNIRFHENLSDLELILSNVSKVHLFD